MYKQDFETPQEALAHYGKKGMKWGVITKDKPRSTGLSTSSKPPELSKDDLSKSLSEFYSKKSAKELQSEGQKKLAQQAAQSFPKPVSSTRERKAAAVDKQVANVDAYIERNKAARDALGTGYRAKVSRRMYNKDIELAENQREALLRRSDQLRSGKLTDNQKVLIGLGATAAVAGLALYGSRRYSLHQAGITPADKKRIFEENHAATTDQWKTMFGSDPKFGKTANYITAGRGGFYGGLTNQKALDRPEFTIPKDTIFQRLSNHDEDSSEYTKGAYATFLHNDKKVYGASGEFGGKDYTINFKPKEDVKVPSLTTVYAHLKKIEAENNPVLQGNVSDTHVASTYHGLAGGSWNSPTAQKLFKSLREHGYSAIVDDMDAGYLGDLPVVFFGQAEPGTARPRTNVDRTRDSVGILKMSGEYA